VTLLSRKVALNTPPVYMKVATLTGVNKYQRVSEGNSSYNLKGRNRPTGVSRA
jgi:hypothetical protein